MTSVQLVAIALVTLPALAIVLWPLVRARGGDASSPAGTVDNKRLELLEEKTSAYRALKELTFDYEAGHLSEDDYRGLHERYESRAAEVLAGLDALGPAPAATAPTRAPAQVEALPARRGWTRHPVTLVGGAVLLLVFGVVIGLNAGRFTEPDPTAMAPGSRPPLPAPQSGAPVGPPTVALEPGKPIPPEMLAGMLQAARQSLFEGRYTEAIAAYQAVLKRDERNVDAMTHLGLIVAVGGHADSALETFDKALKIDPKYAPALMYKGQVLYEVKQDYPGAIKTWERFVAVTPPGEDRQRIALLIEEARTKASRR